MTFTSSLSVADLLLARRAGFRPLGQVYGACAYQIGYAARPYNKGLPWPEYPHAGYPELGGPTRAWNHARERAVEQVREQARELGADAVVAVRIGRRLRGGRLGTVELRVSGTAVATGSGAAEPALSTLTGSEVATLAAAGYKPAGLLAATTVTQVLPGYRTSQAFTWPRVQQNRELADLSRGAVEARKKVFDRLAKQRRYLDADGLVGVVYDQHVERGEEGHGLVVTLHVLGTAVVRTGRAARPVLDLVLDLDQEMP